MKLRVFLDTNVFIYASEFTDIKKEMVKYKKLIKGKDLEQLATVKKLGIKFLLAYDRDFENFEEYITPKSFIKEMGIKTALSNY